MAKMTKAQAKRLLKAIDSKARASWADGLHQTLTTNDYIAIEKIIKRALKRLG